MVMIGSSVVSQNMMNRMIEVIFRVLDCIVNLVMSGIIRMVEMINSNSWNIQYL